MNLTAKIFIFLASSLLSGCMEKPCKTHEFCPQPETAVRYFSVYKSGAWWVYETSDGSKRDSVYVSDYRVDPGQDREDPCYAWEDQYYTCRTKYLTDIGEFHGVNGNLGSCNSSIFTIEERNKGIVGLYSFRNVDTLSNDVNGVKTVSPFYPKSGP
jgi:hypothetical protein